MGEYELTVFVAHFPPVHVTSARCEVQQWQWLRMQRYRLGGACRVSVAIVKELWAHDHFNFNGFSLRVIRDESQWSTHRLRQLSCQHLPGTKLPTEQSCEAWKPGRRSFRNPGIHIESSSPIHQHSAPLTMTSDDKWFLSILHHFQPTIIDHPPSTSVNHHYQPVLTTVLEHYQSSLVSTRGLRGLPLRMDLSSGWSRCQRVGSLAELSIAVRRRFATKPTGSCTSEWPRMDRSDLEWIQ